MCPGPETARNPEKLPDPRDLFEILVRENADMLTSFLRSAVSDAAVVDDLFQETFLVAWKNLDRYDRSRPFAPWVRGIASRLVLAERRRSYRHRVTTEAEIEHLGELFDTFNERVGDTWGEKLEALSRCLDRLKPPLRKVLDLRYQGGLGCREIAQSTGDSLEAVKKRLQRARSQVAVCLGPEVGDGGEAWTD